MIELQTLVDQPGIAFNTTATPKVSDIHHFNTLLSGQSNQQSHASSAIDSLVRNAESKVNEGQSQLSGKIKQFDLKNDIRSLVEATHASSMQSVSIQLTSKVSSKVSEGFEQLIKQQ